MSKTNRVAVGGLVEFQDQVSGVIPGNLFFAGSCFRCGSDGPVATALLL